MESELKTQDAAAREVFELVVAATRGDHGAYAEIVDRFKDSLYRLALGILRRPTDAEDALQEAFIRAYTHLDSYDPSYSFYTWVSAILTNVCYSALRARDWRVTAVDDWMLEAAPAPSPFQEPEVAALLRSRDELLMSAMQTLPEKYRRILELRYWSDLSYQEVADATQQSMGAVKTQIRRGTLLLRDILTSHRLEMGIEG